MMFLPLVLLAQQSPKTIFEQGLHYYQNGNFEQAKNAFYSYLQQAPKGPQVTAAKLMLAKSFYKLGDYTSVEIIAKNFFKRHPRSAYLDDMQFLLGNTFFKQKKYSRAVELWYLVVQNSRDPRLKEKAT